MLFAKSDIEVEGPLDSGTYQQPSGAMSTIWGCAKCKARIFAENSTSPGFTSLRCGTLDRSSEIVVAAHMWISSKQSWIVIPDDVPALQEQPRTHSEWMDLLGPSVK